MNDKRRFQRFALSQRLEHLALIISFTTLAVTGLPQKFANDQWAQWIISALGGIEWVRLFHHSAAVVMILIAIYHVMIQGYKLFVLRIQPTMLLRRQDLIDLWTSVRYDLGLAPRPPRYDRYNYEEKIEYWALIWGSVIMIITGLMMWNPIGTTKFLPGQFILAAKAAHGGEALLAVLAVITWHFYTVHLRHFNLSMFTGTLSDKEMQQEHPLEWERRVAVVEKPIVIDKKGRRRQQVYFAVAPVVSLLCIFALYKSVTFKQITTHWVPPVTVAAYMPITPTPTVMAAGAVSSVISQLSCQACHSDIHADLQCNPHANTQADVAGELSEERLGQTPKEVIHGEDAENCIACHGPTAIAANGGMSETQALSYFFTTINGKFAKDTTVAHTTSWPSVACTTCHKVPIEHLASVPANQPGRPTPSPASLPSLALFNSETAKYVAVDSVSNLCGQCHGSLHFPDTDHLTYNAWASSKHAKTQADVAKELGEERAGQTPNDVINGDDPENCIACHAPTAVLANGGMNEVQALDHFFTTIDGKFTATTAPINAAEWPNVSCIACHDAHNPTRLAYFNSSTKKQEPMQDTSELCGQCHGNLRFPGTDHLSYNILLGTGGIGVPDQQTMPSVTCTDCHMYSSNVDGSNSAMFHGHTWTTIVKEADGKSTVSCQRCHTGRGKIKANAATIDKWKADFKALDAAAQKSVAAAVDAMQGSKDETLLKKLKEAQHNLEYAESDESGGIHNHEYLMALLKDANGKAQEILSALGK